MEHDTIITEAVLLQKVIKEVIKNSKTQEACSGELTFVLIMN